MQVLSSERGKGQPSLFFLINRSSSMAKTIFTLFFLFVFFFLAVFNSIIPVLNGYDGVRWILLAAMPILLVGLLEKEHIFFIFACAVALNLLTDSGSAIGLNYTSIFAIYEVSYWTTSLLVGIALARYLSFDSSLTLVTVLALSSFLVVGLYIITIIPGLLFWYGQGVGRITDFLPFGFYNIRMWAHLATWLIPLSCAGICYFLSKSETFSKRLYSILLTLPAFWFMILLGSGARGSLLAQLLSLAFLLFFYRSRIFDLAKIWALSFALGGLFYFVFIWSIPKLFFEENELYQILRSGDSGRLKLWIHALDLSMREFPFGLGPLSYNKETAVDGLGTPHSFYLLWAAEYGWLILLLFILGFVLFSYPAWIKLRRSAVAQPGDIYQMAVQFSVLSAFLHAGVSGIFTSSVSQLVGLPILIVYFSLMARGFPSLTEANRLITGVGIRFGAFVLLLLSAITIPQIHGWWAQAKLNEPAYIEMNRVPLAPRFWLHGRFVEGP